MVLSLHRYNSDITWDIKLVVTRVWVERDFKEHPVTPLSTKVRAAPYQTRLPVAPPKMALNAFRDVASTASLGCVSASSLSE